MRGPEILPDDVLGEEALLEAQEKEGILMTSRDRVSGRDIVKELGVVVGTSVLSAHVGRDILARLRSVFGGEQTDYQELMTSATANATLRLMDEAKRSHASAVVRVRFQTNVINDRVVGASVFVLAFGTAVHCRARGPADLLRRGL